MEPDIIVHWLLQYGVPALLGLGAGWGGVLMKVRQLGAEQAAIKAERDAADNALSERIGQLSKELAEHKNETAGRLGRIEGKLDTLLHSIIKGGPNE